MNALKNLFCTNRLPSDSRVSQIADPIRSEFDKDFDRIIFSHAFRRLQDKTQVVPLAREDFVHNRLTHSLETAVVGRTLGRRAAEILRKNAPEYLPVEISTQDVGTLVSAACLAHDIGNPPFGHAGEMAIGSAFAEILRNERFDSLSEADKADFVHFEGNAQGFRILASDNLRLTAALLAVFMKYPRPSVLKGPSPAGRAGKKFGFFQTEASVALKVLEICGLGNTGIPRRHPLTWLVEAADDICYLIIDLEDATRMGRLSFDQYLELLTPVCGRSLNRDKLMREPDINERLGVLRALAINELTEAVMTVFETHLADILAGTLERSLTELCHLENELRTIIAFSRQNIYNAPDVAEVQAVGFEVLPGLLKAFIPAVENYVEGKANARERNLILVLPTSLQAKLRNEENQKKRLHLVTDWIAGLTDRGAVNLYRRLKGITL